MKIKITLFALSFMLCSVVALHAQSAWQVPVNAELNTKEDYARYEPDVVQAAAWLATTDLDKEETQRKVVSAFLVRWITGSPTVNVVMGDKLLDLYDKNAPLLPIYLGAYCKDYIENKSTATPKSAAKAGVVAMISVYKKGISIKKSKGMEKVIKLNDENKLDEYVATL